jgi:hypothetical protein
MLLSRCDWINRDAMARQYNSAALGAINLANQMGQM